MKSNCCNANVIVEGNVTKHYVCEACHEACDMKTNPTNQLIEEALKEFEAFYEVKNDDDLITTTNYALKTFFRTKLNIIATKSAEEERKKALSYIEWANDWIEEAADFTYPVCEECGSKAIEDSDGLEDTPDAHLGHSWLQCTNEKCDNKTSDRGGKYRDFPAEAQGLVYEYENLSQKEPNAK